MADKWDVDYWVEGRARSMVKSFYPTKVATDTSLPLRDVFTRLIEMSQDEKLVLKWEIRCPECHDTIAILDDFPIVNDGDTIFCERDQDEIELNIDIIYPIFEINPVYRAKVKENFNKVQKKKSLKGTSVYRDKRTLVPQL